MTFLVQMRQSNNCGSVRNDEIFNLYTDSQCNVENMLSWSIVKFNKLFLLSTGLKRCAKELF